MQDFLERVMEESRAARHGSKHARHTGETRQTVKAGQADKRRAGRQGGPARQANKQAAIQSSSNTQLNDYSSIHPAILYRFLFVGTNDGASITSHTVRWMTWSIGRLNN